MGKGLGTKTYCEGSSNIVPAPHTFAAMLHYVSRYCSKTLNWAKQQLGSNTYVPSAMQILLRTFSRHLDIALISTYIYHRMSLLS